MREIADIIREASELSAEERALVVDSLLRTLHTPDPEIDQAWHEEARRRLDELRSGAVKPIPGHEVFSKVKERFSR
jgi:putative addiction module component (TIGR02574 family)